MGLFDPWMIGQPGGGLLGGYGAQYGQDDIDALVRGYSPNWSNLPPSIDRYGDPSGSTPMPPQPLNSPLMPRATVTESTEPVYVGGGSNPVNAGGAPGGSWVRPGSILDKFINGGASSTAIAAPSPVAPTTMPAPLPMNISGAPVPVENAGRSGEFGPLPMNVRGSPMPAGNAGRSQDFSAGPMFGGLGLPQSAMGGGYGGGVFPSQPADATLPQGATPTQGQFAPQAANAMAQAPQNPFGRVMGGIGDFLTHVGTMGESSKQKDVERLLISKGKLDPAVAKVVAQNPQMVQAILPQIMGIKSPVFGKIGADADGKDTYGWIDSSSRSVTDINNKPIATGGPEGPGKAEREAIQKYQGESYAKIQDSGLAASKTLTTLERMKQLNQQVYEGATAPARQLFGSLLTGVGINLEGVKAGEEFKALSNKLVLDAQNGSLGAGVSNADVAFISATVPTMAQSAAGRKQLIETMTKVKQREIEVAKMAQQWRASGKSMDGFNTFITEWANANPLFSSSGGNAADPLGLR